VCMRLLLDWRTSSAEQEVIFPRHPFRTRELYSMSHLRLSSSPRKAKRYLVQWESHKQTRVIGYACCSCIGNSWVDAGTRLHWVRTRLNPLNRYCVLARTTKLSKWNDGKPRLYVVILVVNCSINQFALPVVSTKSMSKEDQGRSPLVQQLTM
jgi:hypothetical protein